ncbi:hypothetical protein FFLO_06893 [Filobasidium floriforme]|uniref:Protein CASP n=1 Tax=Filobasidium floriforme TaxID=5210 RepID=A0A8K0JFC6_9TREE|nr:CASP C terminal-domain-containing protein [Filobasidium floriforme]KAG7527478.1 hypothetical protein FFLO_06893 [Filobasidium floriforme]KAH8084264.1 CASP C terminal-domain-containing protein [Filobasidium floriforme]
MATVEANFSSALATWKEIDLAETQKQLDKTALELVESQKENLVGRKKLAEQTREFKKLPDEPEKFNAIKTLLKAYQSEIDSLTRRSKSSETAFLHVYKLLAEAPDPYPLLDAAVDQTIKAAQSDLLSSEVDRLKEENGELKNKLGELGNVDERRRRAEGRAEELEDKMEGMLSERVQQKENELNAKYDERMKNYEQREKDLQKQVTSLRDQLKDLHTSNESTQAKLVNASQRQDQDTLAKLAEVDMVVSDLARANERVAAMERRNEMLRSEIESVRSGSEGVEKTKRLEAQLADSESECARLLRTLDQAKAERERVETESAKRKEEVERELTTTKNELDTARSKIKLYADYDEIKRELEIMKYVEFSGGDMDQDDDSMRLPDPNADKANAQHGRSLENLLASKNKRLQQDLTELRVNNEELGQMNDDLTDRLFSVQSDLARLKTLNEKLENDLMRVDNAGGKSVFGGGAGSQWGGGSAWNGGFPSPTAGGDGEGSDAGSVGGGIATPAKSRGLAGLDLGGRKLTDSPVPSSTNAGGLSTPGGGPGDNNANSLLPIVTSQRDRFRQRNSELEEELRKQSEGLADLRAEIKTLQSDNLKLYEKVRYMQSYANTGPNAAAGPSGSGTAGYSLGGVSQGAAGTGASGSGSAGLNGGRFGRLGKDDVELGRYRDKYDESLNPFEAFKGREAQRAISALNPIDRGVFALTRAVVGNKRARSLFIMYSAALHCLVVFVLYNCMGGESMGRSSGPIPIEPIHQ